MKSEPFEALERYYLKLDQTVEPTRLAKRSSGVAFLGWSSPLALGATLAIGVVLFASLPISSAASVSSGLAGELRSSGLALADFGLAPGPRRQKGRAQRTIWLA